MVRKNHAMISLPVYTVTPSLPGQIETLIEQEFLSRFSVNLGNLSGMRELYFNGCYNPN